MSKAHTPHETAAHDTHSQVGPAAKTVLVVAICVLVMTLALLFARP
jgi:hypothetical protein